MATINHKTYNEATETFKDFNVYDGKETLIFKVDGSEGKVGIGTSSPTYNLQVSRSGDSVIAAIDTTGASISALNLGNSTNLADGGIRYDNSTDALILRANNDERMRISSAGNVGIGTTPILRLDVKGAAADTTTVGGVTVEQSTLFRPSNDAAGLRFGFESANSYIWSSTSGGSLFLGTREAPNTNVNVSILPSGNVGIGTASPSIKLELLASASAGLTGNAYYAARFLQDKTNYRGVFLGYDSTAQKGIVGSESGGAASSLAFYTYNGATWAERAAITSDGLTFNGDTAAANALDDYEEGTWTPVLVGAAVSGTYELGDTYAVYTKIGRQVTASMQIQLASSITGGGLGYAAIYGLPFVKIANAQFQGVCSFEGVAYSADIVTTEFTSPSGAVSTIYFRQSVSNSSGSDLLISAFSADDVIKITLTYFV